ncbi:RNA recognition motif, partial [Trifolium medium]|nr:RNA recognition motif [Trifolium medium]
REEREAISVETGVRRGGYLHRLDGVSTSFFFTNFPEDVKVLDLWSSFAKFGRVGDVFIPKKLDKQGRRFGFVKFREVRDEEELLSWISDIWLGTYKLRVNRTRFRRDEVQKKKQQVIQQPQRGEETKVQLESRQGRSFMEALSTPKGAEGMQVKPKSVVVSEDVAWEVEVEEDKIALLRGAYVGILLENVEVHQLQQHFLMDGYHNIKITILGHRKVLLSSSKEDEVKELVGSAGWWCSWFDRFVPWSPASVSNHREVWLSCYGVPLFAWGVTLFRTLAFKFGSFIDIDFGSFIDIDVSTLEMRRGDVARVKIVTNRDKMIDSSLLILVLGQRFNIRVMEENGGWYGSSSRWCGCSGEHEEIMSLASNNGDASFMATVVGGSEEGSDCDPSQSCQVLLGFEQQAGGKGGSLGTRKGVCQEGGVAVDSPNFLGNTIGRVNEEERCILNGYEENCRVLIESAGTGGDRRDETNNMLSNAIGSDFCSQVPFVNATRDIGSASGAVLGDLECGGSVQEDWACDLGPPSVGGVNSKGPAVLRTKE